jgi:hypothetical protein
MDVDTLPLSYEQELELPLETICTRFVSQSIICPDVTPLVVMLTNLPKDDTSDVIRSKILEKEAELEAAQSEVGINLSERFQKMAIAEVRAIENELAKLKSQCPLSPSSSLESFSLAELDKKRAIATASKESWLARSSKKSAETTEHIEEVLSDIVNAQEAHEMQKQHIMELQQTYNANWSERHAAILRSHESKIMELQGACQAKRLCSPVTDSAPSHDNDAAAQISKLQALVTELQAQLQNSQPDGIEFSAKRVRVTEQTEDDNAIGDCVGVAGQIGASLQANAESPCTVPTIASDAFPPLESKGKGKSTGAHY